MNDLGVHALVWVGGWSEEESREAIAGTAACGYDLIEIPLLDPSRVDVEATRQQLEEYGVRAAASLGLSLDTDISSDDDEAVARGEALLHNALAVARDVGSRYLCGVIHSAIARYAKPPTERGRANCAEVLRRLADKAAASDMLLGLEPVNRYESNLLNTGDHALDMIDLIGADNVCVHLDVYHMNIEDGDLAGAIERCGDKLGYFHVGESHRGYLGTGSIDFTQVFRALVRVGYQGPITFESFSSAVVDPQLSTALAIWRDLWTDSEDLARRARAFIEAGMDAARRTTWA